MLGASLVLPHAFPLFFFKDDAIYDKANRRKISRPPLSLPDDDATAATTLNTTDEFCYLSIFSRLRRHLPI